MEYDLYNELTKALGSKFEENMKGFSTLKQYISQRLGNLVYRGDSVQHYGTSHSIFYLNDIEDNMIYQGFWDLGRKSLTIEPNFSFRNKDNGFLIKIFGEENQISFIERKEDKIIVEHLKEGNELLANTKIYSNNDIWSSTWLEGIKIELEIVNLPPDCEFCFKADKMGFSIEEYSLNCQIHATSGLSYVRPEALLPVYFEKINKKLEKMENKANQKKKTIQDSH